MHIPRESSCHLGWESFYARALPLVRRPCALSVIQIFACSSLTFAQACGLHVRSCPRTACCFASISGVVCSHRGSSMEISSRQAFFLARRCAHAGAAAPWRRRAEAPAGHLGGHVGVPGLEEVHRQARPALGLCRPRCARGRPSRATRACCAESVASSRGILAAWLATGRYTCTCAHTHTHTLEKRG